jgi:hypothetical protein
VDYCGPATPDSPCESSGLGSSDFARHYFRNHGCFLFLRVLRWFTSPGSLEHPMYSDARNGCSHPLGFPIRTSPDHSLLAAPRSFSQLIASFLAFLRLGIHTHALSSLTIKSTSHTRKEEVRNPKPEVRISNSSLRPGPSSHLKLHSFALTCVIYARQYSIFKDLDFLKKPEV